MGIVNILKVAYSLNKDFIRSGFSKNSKGLERPTHLDRACQNASLFMEELEFIIVFQTCNLNDYI